MALINATPVLFEPAVAVAKAAELQAADPDWTYTAANPDGDLGPFSAIEIKDEDGELVGLWG